MITITNDFSYIIQEACRNFSGFERFIVDIYDTYKSIEGTKKRIYNYGNPEKINKLKARYSQIDIQTEDIVEKILKIHYTYIFLYLFNKNDIRGTIKFFRYQYGDETLRLIDYKKIIKECEE